MLANSTAGRQVIGDNTPPMPKPHVADNTFTGINANTTNINTTATLTSTADCIRTAFPFYEYNVIASQNVATPFSVLILIFLRHMGLQWGIISNGVSV